MINLWKKIYKAHKEGTLFYNLTLRAKPYFYGLKYTLYDPAANHIKLHCPEYIEPSKNNAEREIVERIFRSFRKMKDDQRQVSNVYLPSSLWQKLLDESYSSLNSGLKDNNLNTFHFFLYNFGTWKEYLGIESATLIRENMKSHITRLYLKNIIFLQQLKTWQWFYNKRKLISSLTYPAYGNQAGAYIDGNFVGVGSFFNEIYGSILSGIIKDKKRPVLADLGGGYGKLGYFTLRDMNNFCFIDFDLPETLCLAAYYLMKCWPQKKTLLYGEEEYSSASHKQYDLIFMPPSEIGKAGENSIDLFINKNSLGEMSKDAVNNYVHCISRSTRYFFHMNHDINRNIYSDNNAGLLGYEYPVPMDKFRLVFRYPDIGHMRYLGGLDYKMDIFLYLYERIGNENP